MKICLLAYDTPHKKTAQVFMGLHNRGFRKIDFLLMPFQRRPERKVLINHRPFQFEGPDPRSLASLSGGRVFDYINWRELVDQYDYFIVCGSNLIEPEFARCGKILNVHAGLIPTVRGLDSFKWAILNAYPLGNTLHTIDERADAGEVLFHLRTPIFPEDDIYTLSARHYENEIWMLINFDTISASKVVEPLPEMPATMRMPIVTETEMVRAFDDFKRKNVSLHS